MKKYTNITSTPFYENVLKASDNSDFTRIQLVFNRGKCTVSLGYDFNGTENYIAVLYDYELRNKRLYLKNRVNRPKDAVWQDPANSAILQKAETALDYFTDISADGFYVTKLSRRIGRYNNPAYTLQISNTPENNTPYYAQMR